MGRFLNSVRMLSLLALLGACLSVSAQTLPVSVDVSGNVASIRIGSGNNSVADVTLTFDEARGLSAGSLGVSASLVNVNDALLLARLPAGVAVPSAFPLLITIQPPALGGLNFDRTVGVEVHTHALPYTAGSRLRLFKAPLDGDFRDITRSIAPGSVRATGTTGGFSQFLVLADTRGTAAVITDKFVRLRAVADLLPAAQQAPVDDYIDTSEDALAAGDHGGAVAALELLRAHVAQQAGTTISETWLASGGSSNIAGGLLAGASSLQYSIGYQRDFGN